jgi:hypothetical protein
VSLIPTLSKLLLCNCQFVERPPPKFHDDPDILQIAAMAA